MKLTKGIAAFAAAVAVAAFAAQDAGRATELALGEYLAFGQLTKDYYEAIVKHAGLQVIHADGAVTLRLQEIGREVATTPVSSSTTIRLKDEYYPLEVTRHVKTWNDCAAVETWVEIRHAETGPIKLIRADSIATPVAASTNAVRVLSLTGRAKNEANVSESRVVKGQTVELISSAGTRDAWEANAAMMVLFGEDVDEERGAVLGVALEWAGTSCSRVRRNWDGKRTEVFAGVDMTTGPYTLDPGVTFTTPKAILVWSEKGKGEVSREYHRWARRHLMPHGDALHPVLLNSWEGSYFSFTEQTLLDMMAGSVAAGTPVTRRTGRRRDWATGASTRRSCRMASAGSRKRLQNEASSSDSGSNRKWPIPTAGLRRSTPTGSCRKRDVRLSADAAKRRSCST